MSSSISTPSKTNLSLIEQSTRNESIRQPNKSNSLTTSGSNNLSSSTSTSVIPSSNHDNNKIIKSIHPNSHPNQRQVLSEETYISTLESIISRDYFPALPALHRDSALLEARAQGDTAKAVSIRIAARQLEISAAEGETEEQQLLNNDKNVPLKQQSVDGFHRLATSQDNEEFEINQKKEILKHRSLLQEIYSSSSNSKQKNNNDDQITDASNLLASDQFNPTPKYNPLLAKTNNENSQHSFTKSSLFFTPLHLTNKAKEQVSISNHETKQIQHSHQPDHLLMPPPMPVKNSTLKIELASQTKINSNSNDIHTDGNIHGENKCISIKEEEREMDREKRIQPSQTRFPYQATSRLPSTSSTLKSTSDEYTSHGNNKGEDEDYYSSTTVTDLDSSPQSIAQERKARRSYIQKERQSFVNLTPIIIPGKRSGKMINDEDDDDDEPIMTWGNVASTPLAVPTDVSGTMNKNSVFNNDNINSYEEDEPLVPTQQIDVREQIGQQLLNDCKRKKHGKRKKQIPATSSLSSTSILEDRAASLTPAAQSLLQSKIGGHHSSIIFSSSKTQYDSNKRKKGHASKMNAREGGAFGSALRQTYSTTPIKRLGISSSSIQSKSKKNKSVGCIGSQVNNTPKVTRITSVPNKKLEKQKKIATRTDGLLQL